MATVSYFELLHAYNTMNISDFSSGFQRGKKKGTLAAGTFKIKPEVHRTAKGSTSYRFFIFSWIAHKQYLVLSNTISNTKNGK